MQALHQLDATNKIIISNVLTKGKTFDEAGMVEERLPFTVKIVRSEETLRKAVFIRHAAYGRHVPALAELLKAPEANDHDEGSVVLLAESKLDGSPLGTMRIQTNRYRKLSIEQSADLPDWLQDKSLAEATRLGIALGRIGRIVKTVLFKAYFQYCWAENIDWMVIGARTPLDRHYEALLFQDVFPGQLIPLRHAGNIPHRILAFELETAKDRWTEANHPLLGFMCNTHHADIDVSVDDGPFLGEMVPTTRSSNTIRAML